MTPTIDVHPQQKYQTVPMAKGILQRKCACGQHTSNGGECEACKKKRLQRKTANLSEHNSVPPLVHEVLRSPGQPLDPDTRADMEPRFGRDFSQVRIHTNDKAARSARAVNAVSYTVGRDLVFAPGQYQPATKAGRHLLAHELSHVVQQNAPTGKATSQPLSIESPDTTEEHEADQVANQIMDGKVFNPLLRTNQVSMMRKLVVDRPGDKIPNPQGSGLDQTNAETVEQYLQKLSSRGNPTVDRTSGQVTMDAAFCEKRGFGGRLWKGMKAGFVTGAMIGAPFFGLGAIPGALIGALVGGIAGIFGADSRAEESATPTSSTCLCDFTNSDLETKIQISDQGTPAGAATLVKVPSPNSPKLWGAAAMSGQLEDIEPWLILGHELCGHAWLGIHERKDEEGPGEVAKNYSHDTRTGETSLAPDYTGQSQELKAGLYLRHGRTVKRENLIRAEHGMGPRGYRLRDPYCGESFWRDRGVPNAPINWQSDESGGTPIFKTFLDECKFLRSQLPESRRRQYRIEERIPEDAPR